MANTITFDTLAYSKALQEAGVPQKQAEAFARAQQAAFEDVFASKDLATKADIALIQKDITRLEVKISQVESSLIKWTISLIVALGAFISALMLGLAGKLPLG